MCHDLLYQVGQPEHAAQGCQSLARDLVVLLRKGYMYGYGGHVLRAEKRLRRPELAGDVLFVDVEELVELEVRPAVVLPEGLAWILYVGLAKVDEDRCSGLAVHLVHDLAEGGPVVHEHAVFRASPRGSFKLVEVFRKLPFRRHLEPLDLRCIVPINCTFVELQHELWVVFFAGASLSVECVGHAEVVIDRYLAAPVHGCL